MVTLTLPFPPSVNDLWAKGRKNMHLSESYRAWKDEALKLYLAQKRTLGTPIKGNFTYHVVLDEKRRDFDKLGRKRKSDGDNRSSKAILDLLQSVGLIEDDYFADAGSWSWGPVEPGTCFIRVFPKVSA